LFSQLERWVEEKPDALSVSFLKDLKLVSTDCSFAEVYRLAQCGAATYKTAGLEKGDRVLIELPTSEIFAASILGAFYMGLVPAVIAPREERAGEMSDLEWLHQLELFDPKAVVTELPSVEHEHTLHIEPQSILAADPSRAGERVHGSEMAYVQFSSGSTGAPKALWLDMEAIVFNLEGMHRRIPVTNTHHVFSWLPVYHDMGLFGTFLLAMYIGNPLTMADPGLFARSPLLWFRVLHETDCNCTVGPPSALTGALQLLERRPIEGLDLSDCRRWLVGAEQVTPSLVRKFVEVSTQVGAPDNILMPVYGMAEVTLAATVPPSLAKPRYECVERKAFQERGLAILADHDAAPETTLEWTACGSQLDGQGMEIHDEHGKPLPEREVGHIMLKSKSLFRGYLVDDQVVAREGDWYDTGDLGYVADGEIFVTGRSREVIIKNGRNYAPERIEELAATVDGVGRGAAFGVFDERRQTERIVLFAEVQAKHLRDPENRDHMRLAIRNALAEAHFEIDEVQLFARGTLSRTTSGKIRRKAIQQQYLEGTAR
jgi:acyl-CoA synthetase (AMP-forming)/AMP-acid ligase II